MTETDKRLKILDNLFDRFDKNIFEAILLIGSMSFGQNCSVTTDSDIDLLFIIDLEKLKNFVMQDFFVTAKYYSSEKIDLLKSVKADGFWIDQYIDDVMINMGIYGKDSFEKFCHMKRRKWRRVTDEYIQGWDSRFKYRGSNGGEYENIGKYKKNEKLFIKTQDIYRKSVFIDNVFSGNLLTAQVIHEKNYLASKNIKIFKRLLKERYGEKGTLNILDYIIKKIPLKKREKFIQEIKAIR